MAAVDHGITLERTPREIVLESPARHFDVERLLQHAGAHVRVESTGERVRVEMAAEHGTAERVARGFFSRANGAPDFPPVDLRGFRGAERPLVSCVILLTANDRFVREVAIPAIVANSQGYALEIIVVYNGAGVALDGFGGVRVVAADEFGCVGRAYNHGVREARGEWVALFHDDATVCDPSWLSESIGRVEAGECAAVSAEFHRNAEIPVAKAVPLVMRRADFLRFGGFDQYYYVGIEDFDLTHTILAAGEELGKARFRHFHGRGMSSMLMYGPDPELFRTLFALNALPVPAVTALAASCVRVLEADPAYQLRLDTERLYLFKKLAPHFNGLFGRRAMDRKRAELLGRILASTQHSAVARRDDLVRYYRRLVNAA